MEQMLHSHLDVFGVERINDLPPHLLVQKFFEISEVLGGNPPNDLIEAKNMILRSWGQLTKRSIADDRMNCPNYSCVGGVAFKYKIIVTPIYKTCPECKGSGVKTKPCYHCKGTGKINGKSCHTCKGSGQYFYIPSEKHNRDKIKKCNTCKGLGKLPGKFIKKRIFLGTEICRVCNGKGFINKNKILTETDIDKIFESIFPGFQFE